MPSNFFNLGWPWALQLLWLLVPLAVLFALDIQRRNRVLRLFVERSLLDDVAPRRSVTRPVLKFTLWSLGVAALILGLARPRWDPRQIELEQRGQNILFCLDVSNSMRARDVDPSRLEAAKAAIRSLLTHLPAGHQVGILAYAGDAELKCPLTPNYQHAIMVLDRITYNTTSVGGTNLGDAIDNATREVFGLDVSTAAAKNRAKIEAQAASQPAGRTIIEAEQPEADRYANVLVVVTDGEDNAGDAQAAARQAHDLGVSIYLIGMGTEAGAPIPIEEDGKITNLKFKGEDVITKFNDASLRAVIEGIPDRVGYLPAGSSNVDLLDVYKNKIALQSAVKRKMSYTVWDEKFQLFVGVGLALLVIASLVNEQRPAASRGVPA